MGVDGRGAISDSPRRLTLNDRNDWVAGWTADGRGLFFISDREGTPRLFRQRIDQPTAEPLVAAPGRYGGTTTPDGTWLFYWRVPRDVGATPRTLELMRVPTAGGPAELVLVSATTRGLRCALRPESTCLLGETAGDTIVVSRVGPTGGRGEEVARIRVRDVHADWDWNLPDDGSRIAVVERDTIRVLNLTTHEMSTVVLRNANEVRQTGEPVGISWTASGRGFFLTNSTVLFCVDLAGQARELYRTGSILSSPPISSPDGRHIAFNQWTRESNAWLLEHF
jgi:hypothetical protein